MAPGEPTFKRHVPLVSLGTVLAADGGPHRVMIQLVFRDPVWTLKSGEDITLSFAARHHGKVPIMAFRGNVTEGRTWGGGGDSSGNVEPMLGQENRTWSAGARSDADDVKESMRLDSALCRPISRSGYKYQDGEMQLFEDHLNLRWNLSYHLWQRGWPTTFARSWRASAEGGGGGGGGAEPSDDREPERQSLCRSLVFLANAQQARVVYQAKQREWLRLRLARWRHATAAAASRLYTMLGIGWSQEAVFALDEQCRLLMGPHAEFDGTYGGSTEQLDARACVVRHERLAADVCIVTLGPERDVIDQVLGIARHRRRFDMRILDLQEEEHMSLSFASLFSRILSRLQSVLEAVQPSRLLVVDDGTISSAAAALCAALHHVHVESIRPRLGQGAERHDVGADEGGAGDAEEAETQGVGPEHLFDGGRHGADHEHMETRHPHTGRATSTSPRRGVVGGVGKSGILSKVLFDSITRFQKEATEP
jgi:hypothetical protein